MFAGIFALQPGTSPLEFANRETLLDALNPYKQAETVLTWHDESMLLVQIGNKQQTCQNPLLYRCPQTSAFAVFWGRLDNRDELVRLLELPADSSDHRLILAAYQRWQENCPEHLTGDFAFAIADPHSNRLFLSRDPLGVKPLYYLADERFFAFGASAAVFLRLNACKPEPDLDWAAAYLADLTQSYTRTAYRSVLKLAPGHSLMLQQGKINLRKYFQFRDDAPVARRRDASWVEAYREILEESVRCRLSPSYPMGFENSGGMDSVTVIGCAAKHSKQPLADLHCFSFAFNELEPEYMLGASHYCGIVNNHIVSQLQIPDEDLYARALQANGYPLEWHNGQASPVFFYRWARQLGIRSFFSGFGGDECVTGFAQHARFELLANRQYPALWNILPGNPLKRTLRYAKAVKEHLRPPANSPGMHGAFVKYRQNWILRPELMEKLHEPYMKRALYDAPYRRVNDFILQDRLSPLLTTRLENSTLMSQAYGMDYCAPLLDVRLIQQYLSTPTIEKAGNGMGRFLHRRAVEGLIPPKLQWNRGKDLGNWGFKTGWQAENLKQIAKAGSDELADLHPAIAEIVDIQKLSSQIDCGRQGLGDDAFFFQFQRNILKLRWLNRWLRQHG